MNPYDLVLSPTKYSMVGGILAHMFVFNQAIAYSPSLHISKATNIKIIFYCCCLRLPLNDESKKKVEEMPNRHKKVQDLL